MTYFPMTGAIGSGVSESTGPGKMKSSWSILKNMILSFHIAYIVVN